jgi:PAS domain S-box-containing protein
MTNRKPLWLRLVVASVLAGAALGLRLGLLQVMGTRQPFLTFYPAVMLAALYGGLGAGMLTAALSSVLADYFFLQPVHQLAVLDPADWLGLAVFLLSSALIGWIAESMNRAQRRARAAELQAGIETARQKDAEAKEFLATIVQSSEDAILSKDLDGIILSWNAAAERMFGYKAGEIIGRNIALIISPDRVKEEELIIQQVKRGERVNAYDTVRVGKDGGRVEVSITVSPLRNAQGRIVGASKIIRDITRRKQAEEALRLSEEKFSTAFAGNPAAITITRLEDGLFLDVNETWEALNGYGRGEVLGLSARKFGIWPTDSARSRFAQELKEKGSLRGWEQEFRKKSGEIFVAQLSAQILSVHGEKVILSTLVDITGRRRKEEELGRLNRTLKALHESNRAMMSTRDEPHYLQEVCQIVVQVCGHVMVWIGFAENDEARSIVPAACAGKEDGYIKALNLTWADTERGRGPTGIAIRTGKSSICRNMLTDPAIAPWRQLALEHGYAASLALPLLADGRAFGAITIYSPQPDSLSESEVMLLTELAEELAQGIITRRLRAERARVEEQLRLLSSAVEAAANGIALTDRQGKILWINPAFTRLTGYSLQEAVGQNPRVLKSGKHPPEFYANMWATIARGEPWSGELVNRRKDGSFYTEQMTIAPVRAGGAGVTHFVAIKQDVTARKRAEDRTRLMAETVGQLLKSDAPQRIANELCEKVMDYLDCQLFFNFLVDEQPGRLRLNACAGVSEEQAAKVQSLEFGVGVSGCVARDQCRIVAEDVLSTPDPRTELIKSVGLQAYACHPLMAEGKLIGTLSFGTKKRARFTDDELSLMKDVADHVAIALQRQSAQAALRQSTLELERSNQELQQFAYVASHDLQEPLRAVAGYLGLIDERFRDKLDDKGRHYMAGALEGAERMHTLINDLLDLSRVGTRGGEFQSADLNAVLDIALKNLSVTVQQANAVVTRSPLPTLAVDANQIVMLFQNLMGNAVKFHGGRPPEIDVSARWQAGHWVFAVRDNGIGIEPQYYEQIFQIFRRLHTRKQYPGTGIGLAVCKKIVERHGGRIWVQSQPGLGSTFLFTLPDQKP